VHTADSRQHSTFQRLLVSECLCYIIHNRSLYLTRPAPHCPKIHENRFRRLKYLCIKILIRDCFFCHNIPPKLLYQYWCFFYLTLFLSYYLSFLLSCYPALLLSLLHRLLGTLVAVIIDKANNSFFIKLVEFIYICPCSQCNRRIKLRSRDDNELK